MDSSPPPKHAEPTLPPPGATAGTKRPPPTLLPPFEPSSSPGLPRPAKRQATGTAPAHLKYPTPVPTSSTGILSSSPPRRHATRRASTASERAPLSAVPSVVLSANGETLLMGRSSNSSHYQLSSNRLISRVHVRARYVPAPSPLEPSKLEIVCGGWNGLALHCQGRTYELWKGDSFTSETEGTEVMLDVQDARVLVQWPRRSSPGPSEASWDESPKSRPANTPGFLPSSPLRRQGRIQSPVSPTPAHLSASRRLDALMPAREREENVEIYVDPSADEEDKPVDPNASLATEATNSFSSDLSDLSDGNDPDEENDPIVHSFGPFGANLSSRLASITASSPKVNRSPTAPRAEKQKEKQADEGPSSENTDTEEPRFEDPAIENHVVNQLAFSRLSSTPLSTILQNLPSEERARVSKPQLQSLIEGTSCVGVIARQGKDAAGKPLESEYYYVPEEDGDRERKETVTEGLRKPSLRACRKQHKVSLRPCVLFVGLMLMLFSNTIGRDRGHREGAASGPPEDGFTGKNRFCTSSVESCFMRLEDEHTPCFYLSAPAAAMISQRF